MTGTARPFRGDIEPTEGAGPETGAAPHRIIPPGVRTNLDWATATASDRELLRPARCRRRADPSQAFPTPSGKPRSRFYRSRRAAPSPNLAAGVLPARSTAPTRTRQDKIG